MGVPAVLPAAPAITPHGYIYILQKTLEDAKTFEKEFHDLYQSCVAENLICKKLWQREKDGTKLIYAQRQAEASFNYSDTNEYKSYLTSKKKLDNWNRDYKEELLKCPPVKEKMTQYLTSIIDIKTQLESIMYKIELEKNKTAITEFEKAKTDVQDKFTEASKSSNTTGETFEQFKVVKSSETYTVYIELFTSDKVKFKKFEERADADMTQMKTDVAKCELDKKT